LKAEISPVVNNNWPLVSLLARKRGVRRGEVRRPRSH